MPLLVLLCLAITTYSTMAEDNTTEESVKEVPGEGVAEVSDENYIDYTTGTPWLCSILDGNVTADTEAPELSEDFYLACNIEKLQNMQIPEGYNSYGTQEEVAIQLNEDIINLFSSLYDIGITVDKDDSSSYILGIKCGELMLNDAAEYQELTSLKHVGIMRIDGDLNLNGGSGQLETIFRWGTLCDSGLITATGTAEIN